jgi:glycosyltransferase involved in cell wall biosynthesis
MRILYDGAIYQWQTAGGINRYFANLISRLPQDFSPVLTTSRKRGITFPQHPRLKIVGFERFRPQRLSLKLEKLYFNYKIGKQPFDLVHPTYYTLLSQAPIERRSEPLVVTFWDMIHDLFPELDPSGHVVAMKRKAVAAADAIICISENTRQDLIDRYGVAENKISVTHLASEVNLSRASGNQPVPSRPYFLYVGSRQGYKNFAVLLSAFAKLANGNNEPILCLVGPDLSASEQKQIAELGIATRLESYGSVDDDHLAKLYKHSTAFIYPSLYEGFGLPPLEAMSCGAVVIASNRASLPEVVGDAGLLFDPESADKLVEAMLHILENPAVRQSFIEKGLARSRLFSWDKTAEQTVALYRSLTGR